MKERILQFGEGGFLRGFADWMLQIVNEQTDFDGSVVVIQPIKEGMCDLLSAQGSTYTHVMRGAEGVEIKKIEVISRCVKPYEDFDAYLVLAENQDFRFVISNTTEAGIAFSADDKITDAPAKSFPGKLTQLLKRRYDLALPGFVFLPCELIDKNGENLKKCVLQYAELWSLGDGFKSWIEKNNIFCNTLVDRINTGYPKGETIDVGFEDKMLNTSEYFHLWVIEGYANLCDEIAEGVRLIEELKAYAATFVRTRVPISKLKVGLKCGGSDGFSGITANPLVGRFCDRLSAYGGSCVLTEVPEMFGAEHLLMNRCESEAVFAKTVKLINDFKDYYTRYGQVIYENPSPGNKKGGITILEEKSLGCVQKGGLSPVVDVLDYGDRLVQNGLSLLNGPGNDIVAVTNLMAAGVHMILFTTGRGTPLGTAVPTVKIATNAPLAQKKANWIDFDASPILEGKDPTDDLIAYAIRVANGERTKNEVNGYEEISIFKDGVTL